MNREERRKLAKDIRVGGLKRVGQRLPGVNIGSVADRTGIPIDKQVDMVIEQAQEAAEPMPEQAGHVPAIGALDHPEDAWGVFCLRCSAEAEQYVYPCKVDPEDWPPQVLYEAAPSPTEV